jgi:hypothetical protein
LEAPVYVRSPSKLLAALAAALWLAGCSDSPGSGVGTVRGRVRTQDGSELSQVTVRSGDKSAKTDADGYFKLELGAGAERRLTVDSKEFAGGDALVHIQKGEQSSVELGVMSVRTLKIDAAEKGGEYAGDDGFALTLPEKALRGAKGEITKGKAELRYAAVRDPKLMHVPPELRARDADGKEQRLKSQGLVEVRFYSGDEQLELQGEVELQLQLPQGSSLKQGDRIGLYHYDEKQRRFTKQTDAEVRDGKWVAKVDRFSWWTVAEPSDASSCVTATLRTPDGDPASNVVASAVGVADLWVSSATSDADGTLCLEAPAGEALELSAFWSDAERSAELSLQAPLPDQAAQCGGDGCLDLGRQRFSALDDRSDAGGGDAGGRDGGASGTAFAGLMETQTARSSGEVLRFQFDAAGGERLAYTLLNEAGVTADIRLLGPDGQPLGVGNNAVSPGATLVDDAFLLPTRAGRYTLEVTPRSGTGSFTLDLFGVPDDATAELHTDADAAEVSVESVAQNARLPFSAEGGERLAYTIENGADVTADVSLFGPAGTRLSVGNLAVSSGAHGFSDQFVLPAVAGEYYLQIDPRQQGRGSFTVTLITVPEDAVVDVTPDAGEVTLALNAVAQNGAFRLRGARGGERLAYTLRNAASTTVDSQMLDPAGKSISAAGGGTSPGSSRFADAFLLPDVAGDYLLTVDPRAEGTGSIGVTLISVPIDAMIGLTIDGAPSNVGAGSVGQNVYFSFDAAGGERIAYTLQSFADNTADVSLIDPNGQTVSAANAAVSAATTLFQDAFVLPAVAGGYQLRVDPRDRGTGSFTATLFSVPPDATTSAALQDFANATDQPLSVGVAGQNASFDFSGAAAGELVAYYLTNNAGTTVDAFLRDPGGATVSGSSRGFSPSSTTFVDAFNLGSAGTYRLVVDPRQQGTGSVSVRLFRVSPARPNASVTVNGGASRVAVTVPGQTAAFSVALTAGQSFGYSVSRTGGSTADVRLLDPSQRDVTPVGGSLGGDTALDVKGVTAASTGTYTLEVDARSDGTDTYVVSVTSP